MKITGIKFEFVRECKCDGDYGDSVEVTMRDVVNAGIPICGGCGDEFLLLDDCEVLGEVK